MSNLINLRLIHLDEEKEKKNCVDTECLIVLSKLPEERKNKLSHVFPHKYQRYKKETSLLYCTQTHTYTNFIIFLRWLRQHVMMKALSNQIKYSFPPLM